MQPLKNGSRILRDGVMLTHLQSSDGATALVADHGAHLLSWHPAGCGEALFLSSASGYGGNAAIRGGVPVIFPQFAAMGPGKRHGFARTTGWRFVGASEEEGTACASWLLDQSLLTGVGTQSGAAGIDAASVPGFQLTCDIRLVADTIEIGLAITNTSTQAWGCQAALHTYLRVDALESVHVDGLQGAPYVDQTRAPPDGETADAPTTCQDAGPLAFAAEVDRIYLAAPSPVVLHDAGRRLEVVLQGFPDMVVWNPGQAKAAALADLHAGGFREFVCIEAAAIGRAIRLEPGERWRGAQLLRLPGN